MGNIKYGVLHNHTEYSVRDSAMSARKLCERAKELGAPAVALTDHGILTGVYDFLAAAKACDIKPIIGMEAYYATEEKSEARHLVLMAKDRQGYRAICRAVRFSYENIVKKQPCMTDEILEKVFGEGSDGHGHVIATSACAGGVLAKILREDETLEKSVEKLVRKRDKYHPVDDEVLDVIHTEQTMEEELAALIQKRDELTEASKINLTGLKRRVKALSPTDADYEVACEEMEKATRAKEEAKTELESVKRAVADKRRSKSAFSKENEKLKSDAEKWASINEQITQVLSTKQGDEVLFEKTKQAAQRFVEIFGKDNFYIELQYHHIEDEKKVMPILAGLALELDIPVVAANDAHYATNNPNDIRARELVSALRFHDRIVGEEVEEGFDELYIRDDDEMLATLSEIINPVIIEQAIENIGKIVEECNITFSSDTHYPVFPSENGETAAERLRRLSIEGIEKRYPDELWKSEYMERLEYELGVIETMGFSDYLCIVQDFLEYGRKLGFECPEEIGYTIGPGRGSAVGSIVCYLTGITSVDPMRYNLLFERFLNPERVSLPDIDSDFAPEVRDRVIDYVREKYRSPEANDEMVPICSIITKNTMAARAAVRDAARVTGVPLEVADRVAKTLPTGPNVSLSFFTDEMVEQLCGETGDMRVRKLIEDARLIEGTASAYGVHAAGVIIVDNGDVGEYVPLYRAIDGDSATGPWIAQLDKDQCEKKAGLLKMDFLGLNNLDIISDALRRIYRNHGVRIDIEHLTEEPEVFSKIFAAGNTDSVFQFESDGMKGMLRQFRPSTMEDLVLLVAAYRPGPLQYLPGIIRSKHGKETPEYVANGLDEILDTTYGYPVYQEQVMQIFNKIAGFSLGEADIIRRAMSKKHLNVLTDPETNYHGKFIDGLIASGASNADAEDYWDQLLDFANYAFNKSHAAAYAVVAYMTGWLKYHYPAEYMCAVMSKSNLKKLPKLIADSRKMGLSILPPDINHSQDGFINDGNSILFGFGSIKGLGASGSGIIAERSNGSFVSMKDFITRMLSGENASSCDKQVVSALISAGAFDAFCGGNRASLLNSIDEFTDKTKNMLKKQKIVEERTAVLEELQNKGASAAEIQKAERSLRSGKKSLDTASLDYAQHSFILVPENLSEKLAAEYELLGQYVSGNPFNEYDESAKRVGNRVLIIDAAAKDAYSNVTICGMVKGLRMLQSKRDHRAFCVFTLFDETSEIEVCCFADKYSQYRGLIEDGAALTIAGRINSNKRTNDDGEEVDYGVSVTVNTIEALQHGSSERIIITADSLLDWIEHQDEILSYESASGYEAYYCDRVDAKLRKVSVYLSKDILNTAIPGITISMQG